MAAENQENFLMLLQEIVDNQLLNKALNQHTHRLMLSFLVSNPPEWLYRYSSQHTRELVSAIFSLVEGLLNQPEFEHRDAQGRIIGYIMDLYENLSDDFFDEINNTFLARVLNDFTRSTDWQESYDDLYDRFVSKGYQLTGQNFDPNEVNQIRRYERLNHDEFELEVLKDSTKMRYLDASGVTWDAGNLFGINDGNDQFDLSFDRYCSVENVYIFRITYHNYALRILRDLEKDNILDRIMVNPTDSESVPAELDRYKEILDYLLNSDNLDSANRISRKKMEEDLDLRLSDDVVARAIQEIFEKNQISIQVVAKGDPNLESYVVASEDVDSLHPEFVDWFEDKSSTKKYYECRGLPHAAKRAASLINEWTPKIIQHYKDNLHGHQYTVFARKIAQNQFAKSQNGSPAPAEYSMIWKMGFYCIRDGLKPDLRKFWLAELVKHQMSSQRKKFKVDEYARKQIQIWYKTVLSLLEDDPTPTEVSELAHDPIPEAYRIIKDISIYGGASSKARIVEALKTLQGAKETKQFTQARKGMSLSGPVRPMHQDTYAYLKNNVGKSFIDIPSALIHCSRYMV